jgi:hypothetical protein
MTRARSPGRQLIPGRWKEHDVAVPDVIVKRLPPCRPLPKLEQRPSRERVIPEVFLGLAALLLSAAIIALLVATRR